jgi:hypothetical protein
MLPRCNSQSITPRSCVESCPPKFRSFPSRALIVSGAGIGSSCLDRLPGGPYHHPEPLEACYLLACRPAYGLSLSKGGEPTVALITDRD